MASARLHVPCLGIDCKPGGVRLVGEQVFTHFPLNGRVQDDIGALQTALMEYSKNAHQVSFSLHFSCVPRWLSPPLSSVAI